MSIALAHKAKSEACTASGKGLRERAWASLAVCCAAQFMVVLDVSIVNVALPAMRSGLGLSQAGQQWVVNAYTLTFAGLLLLGGRAADIFGRRRVFMAGLGAFTVCSLFGGLAQSGAWLIAARAAQGAGGAVLAPATLSLLTTTFVEPSERRKALGAWSATAASGAAVGVLLGGVLTDLLGWRSVLFVNVPIGVALMVGTMFALPAARQGGERRRLDVAGALTATAGLSALVYGVVNTGSHPWGSTGTVAGLAAAGVLLAAFAVIEGRLATDPLVPLGIFRLRSLSAANAVAMTVGAGLFGMYFFLSLYLQQVNGYSPLEAGLAFLPSGLAVFAGALSAARLVARVGARRQLVGGLVIAAGGLFWLSGAAPGSGYFSQVLGPAVLVGLGFGLSFVPMTMSAMAGVPARDAGLASGILNTSRQVGGAVGLAVLATIAVSASHVHAGPGPAHAALGALLTRGYDRAFVVAAFVLLAGAALSLALPAPARRLAGSPEEAGARARAAAEA
jgi:EmrB/QacA subfamily drug resistance transporter